VEMVGRDPFLEATVGGKHWHCNWEDREKYYIASLSGGKDSTAMLDKMIKNDIWIDEVITVDPGKEFPAMERHIKELQELCEQQGIKFTHLEADKGFRYWLGEHIKTRGKNKGKQGYGWPDFQNRWCTAQLKTQVLENYYRQLKEEKEQMVEFVGIAHDEQERLEKNQDTDNIKDYPLDAWYIEEDEALEYCWDVGYDWGGLYEKFGRVSCFLCPLSSLDELRYTFWNYPELWAEMRMLDDMSYRDFRSDYTLAELEHKFWREYYEELFQDNVSYGKQAMKQSTIYDFAS